MPSLWSPLANQAGLGAHPKSAERRRYEAIVNGPHRMFSSFCWYSNQPRHRIFLTGTVRDISCHGVHCRLCVFVGEIERRKLKLPMVGWLDGDGEIEQDGARMNVAILPREEVGP